MSARKLRRRYSWPRGERRPVVYYARCTERRPLAYSEAMRAWVRSFNTPA